MITATREQRRQLARDNAKLPALLAPMELVSNAPPDLIKAWRSKEFLVQGYFEDVEGVLIRLSVNRSTLGNNGRWLENITWDELQALKRQAGYGDKYAVEIYPQDKEVVNVANMRHLWILENPLKIGWFKK